MKLTQFLASIVTVFVLVAIDNQAASADGLANYGDLMRAVVWALVCLNVVRVYEFVRAYPPESDFE